MLQCYSEITNSTAVNCSISCCFLDPTETNLIVGKTSLLQIFRIVECEAQDDGQDLANEVDNVTTDRRLLEGGDHEESFVGGGVMLQRTQVETTTRLVLVAEYHLSGSIISMASIRTISSKSGGDCLLLATESAKVSILQWDPSIHAVSTISLHYYEREEFRSLLMPEHPINFLTADPKNRCAALKFNQDMLAIFPFRQKEDEDLVMEDDYEPKDADEVMKDQVGQEGILGVQNVQETPYYPSFVVTANQLDEAIEQIIDVTFLHEYREPTFAILYQPIQTWTGMLEVRKDTVSFIIITLDLEQRASTPILSVTNLPYDIYKAVALPVPISGTLLIGTNEIIHIDQAGKTTAVAVNQYASQSSAFAMGDQSDLELILDGVVAEALDGENGDVLLITKDGSLVLVSFKTDGRNVSGLKVKRITKIDQSKILGSQPISINSIGKRRLFIGSFGSDSIVLGWRRRGEKTGPTGKSEVLFEEEEDVLDEDVDDDLYGDAPSTSSTKNNINGAKTQDGKTSGEYIFRTHDRLINIGPCRDMTFGRPAKAPETIRLNENIKDDLELVTTSGENLDGSITILKRTIIPQVMGRFEYKDCVGVWAVKARKNESRGPVSSLLATINGVEEDINVEEEYDRYMIASKTEESLVFKVGAQFDELKGTEFDTGAATLNIGTFMDGQRIAQVWETDVRVYDSDLQLTQIIPMFDDDTGAEPSIVFSSFADPFMLLIRSDQSAVVYRCDNQSMEVEEVERADSFKSTKWLAGCLCGEILDEELAASFTCFLVNTEGLLKVYKLPGLSEPIFIANNFDTLPPVISRDNPTKSNVKDNVHEILVTELGDQYARSSYLLVRTDLDDIIIYEIFWDRQKGIAELRFVKMPNPVLPRARLDDDATPKSSLISLDNVGGYACVFMTGISPTFIMKDSKGTPKLFRLAAEGVRNLSTFHTSDTERGFLYVDLEGVVRVCTLPDVSYENAWLARRVAIHETPLALAYYPPTGVYAVSTVRKEPLDTRIDDELLPDTGENEMDTSGGALLPDADNGRLQLISPLTWSIIDTYDFAENEVALVVKTLHLEVSEQTKLRKELLAVGTGVMTGEDHAARGAIYVFEVIEVVPEPGKPETNRKLKLLVREEVKGTVSAICGVNGFLLAAQGQKVMVRGLKEDMSLLPVAFMDMNMYVSVAKSLHGMVLFGDFLKSMWFVGFSEEPYKMTLFGKDIQQLQVMAADFLPDQDQLYFVIADADSNIHVLQYDPENPKSLAGQRLIRCADFFAGHEIRSITMLPRNTIKPQSSGQSNNDSNMKDEEAEDQEQEPTEEYMCLTSSMTGVFGVITTLPESTYRRLNILQGQLTNGEEHVAGLNPRAYRASRYKSTNSSDMLRSVLDGGFLRRWLELSSGRRKDLATRAGATVEQIREDLWELQEAVGFF